MGRGQFINQFHHAACYSGRKDFAQFYGWHSLSAEEQKPFLTDEQSARLDCCCAQEGRTRGDRRQHQSIQEGYLDCQVKKMGMIKTKTPKNEPVKQKRSSEETAAEEQVFTAKKSK
jgi:hypothetical protein